MTEKTKKALEQARLIIKYATDKPNYDPNYRPVRWFSKQNIKGMLRQTNLTGKKVLLVNPAPNHIFNILLTNPQQIEIVIDNPLDEFLFHFMLSAVRCLDYKSFLNFFFKSISNFYEPFSVEAFTKIFNNIKNKETKSFWLDLFKEKNGTILCNSALFQQITSSKNTYKECNDFLKDEASYRQLQEQLETFEYNPHVVDILESVNNLPKEQFDFIYLSDKLAQIRCEDELEAVRKIKEVVDKLQPYLTEEGRIGLCYLYSYLNDSLEFPLSCGNIADYSFRATNFTGKLITEHLPFTGFDKPKRHNWKTNDAVAVVGPTIKRTKEKK